MLLRTFVLPIKLYLVFLIVEMYGINTYQANGTFQCIDRFMHDVRVIEEYEKFFKSRCSPMNINTQFSFCAYMLHTHC